MIELSEMISELRRELDQAIDAGVDERLRFELGPVEVEVTVGLDSKGTAGAKVRFWVVEPLPLTSGTSVAGCSVRDYVLQVRHDAVRESHAP